MHPPQSVGQVAQLSPSSKLQIESPQVPPQARPQPTCTSQMHVVSQAVTQQYESTSQIFLAQGSQVPERGRPTVHKACAQTVGPQSLWQVPEVS